MEVLDLSSQFVSLDSTYYLSGGTLCGPIASGKVTESWVEVHVKFVGNGPFTRPQLLVASGSPSEQHVAIPLRPRMGSKNPNEFKIVLNGEKAAHELFLIPSLENFELESLKVGLRQVDKRSAGISVGVNLIEHPRVALKSYRWENLSYIYRKRSVHASVATKLRSLMRSVMDYLPDPDSLNLSSNPHYTRWLNEKYESLVPRTTSLGVNQDSRFGAFLSVQRVDPDLVLTLNSLRSAGMASENIVLLVNEELRLERLNREFNQVPASEIMSALVIQSDASHLLALRAGDTVSRSLLGIRGITELSDLADAIYFDSDEFDKFGNLVRHNFRPDASPVTILFNNYIGRAVLVSKMILEHQLRSIPELRTQEVDGMIYASSIVAVRGDIYHVQHVSKPLIQFRVPDAHTAASVLASEATVRALVTSDLTPKLDIELGSEGKAFWKVRSNESRLVSILIPTRDRVDLLKPALDSILANTDYPNFSVVIIDNQSQEKVTHDYLEVASEISSVSVASFDGDFNFAKMHNHVTKTLSGDLILLLNNDTEVTDSHWLSHLVALFNIPGVGIVGNKLVYPDNTIQHAGAIGGLNGPTSHPLVGIPGDMNHPYLNYPRDVLAVTGACLMISLTDYLKVGGMDESLAVSYNDMDLCLKVRTELRKSVVVSNSGGVMHKESKSLGLDFSETVQLLLNAEADYFEKKWYHQIRPDPFYNPNLSLKNAFELGS